MSQKLERLARSPGIYRRGKAYVAVVGYKDANGRPARVTRLSSKGKSSPGV